MSFVSLLMLAGAAIPTLPGVGNSQLLMLMKDVTEACVLPDLRVTDPRTYLASNGWREASGQWKKNVDGTDVSVEVQWPASKETAASCSFTASSISPREVGDFFVGRIGAPNDSPGKNPSIRGWKIKTNDHSVGIYVSPDDPTNERQPGLLLHIFQGWSGK